MSRDWHRRLALGPDSEEWRRVCEYCEGEYQSFSTRRRYCSHECRYNAGRHREIEKREAAKPPVVVPKHLKEWIDSYRKKRYYGKKHTIHGGKLGDGPGFAVVRSFKDANDRGLTGTVHRPDRFTDEGK